MDTSTQLQIETLTGELWRLRGWGVTPATAEQPTLSKLSHAEGSLKGLALVSHVGTYIEREIEAMNAPFYEIEGKRVSAERLQWGLKLLVRRVRKNKSARVREADVIEHLGLNVSHSTFRKSETQWNLLRLLAAHMIERARVNS